MIKTLRSSLGRDREKFKIPRSVQQSVPISRVWPDGILQVGNRFSKCFAFSDINYAIASDEDKESAFYKYSDVLNALDSENVKITIHNRKQKRRERPPKGSSHGQGRNCTGAVYNHQRL